MDKTTQALYLALNDRAYEIISSPDYVPVLPPRRQMPGRIDSRMGYRDVPRRF